MDEIAGKLVDLQVCEAQRSDLKTAYTNCSSNTHGGLSFWQTPTFVAGEFVVTVGVTAAVICVTHVMGACL